VISFVHARRQCAPYARRVSNCLASCCATGRHYHRPAWTQLHRRWLASLKFDQAAHHIVLEDCIAAVEAAMARRDRLETHIEAVLPEWSLAPVVEALQALRGVRLVAAATLVAELGDITRFTNPRQLMAYLGLVPSEHSSGRTRRQGGGWFRRHALYRGTLSTSWTTPNRKIHPRTRCSQISRENVLVVTCAFWKSSEISAS